MTKSDKWRNPPRPGVAKYWAFCDDLRTYHLTLPASPLLVFHVPMPPSWSEKKKAKMYGTPHESKPDIDNFIKAVLDALSPNDSYVWRIAAMKIWDYSGSIQFDTFEPTWGTEPTSIVRPMNSAKKSV